MKFLRTIPVSELKQILNNIPKISFKEEMINLQDSFNRVLSKEVKSQINVPHFRKSRMDGYAVIAEDTFGAEEDNLIDLKLIEIINAGDKPEIGLHKGECAYVATGAALPENANAVVMVEYSEKEDDIIKISQAVSPGTNIVKVSHDVKKDSVVCKKDTFIDLPTIGILASCGIGKVPVYSKPLVSLMSTGNEIVSLDIEELPIGKIYDINSIMLKKAIENTGARVNFMGIIKDKFNELKTNLNQAIAKNDIIILSGGTSKGEGDLIPQILESMVDIDLMIHGVRIKPGKPLIFSKLRNKILFVLPGFPTSALSCYFVFIENFLRRMSGYPLKDANSVIMEVGERIYSEVGRHEFKTVTIKEINGEKQLFPIKTGSEAISTMFNADGYIEIEELENIIEKGDKRRVYFF